MASAPAIRVAVVCPDVPYPPSVREAFEAEQAIDLVGWFSEATAALDFAAAGDVDVMVLAAELPGAARAAHDLRELNGAPKLILMSNDGFDRNLVDAASGAVAFIRKAREVPQMVSLVVAVASLAAITPDD